MKKKKEKRWIKKRHQAVRNIVGLIYGAYVKKKYNANIRKFDNPGKKPLLILYNHQTGFDQFFVGLSFKEHVYYLATEDIFSMGFLSKLIKFLVAPIPIKKQSTDLRAVLNCIKVAKEGGSIAIAPEGNRTFNGRTVYIKPGIVSLAKRLGLPIAFYRIEGGYGVQPRWSDVVRGGGLTAGVSRVMYPDEYMSLSDDELYEVICRELYVDEACADREFHHSSLAEYLERAIYVCPYCGISRLESRGDTVECLSCRRQVKYLPSKEFQGVGFDFPFRFVNDWYEYQMNFVNSLDMDALSEEAICTDEVTLSRVILYKKKKRIYKKAALALYNDRLTVLSGGKLSEYPLDGISAVSVLGKNKLNLYVGKDVFQISGSPRFCALKYVNLYHRYKNLKKGEKNAEFLGL